MLLSAIDPRDVQRAKLKGREKEASLGEIDPVPQFSDRITFEKDAVFELTAIRLDNGL